MLSSILSSLTSVSAIGFGRVGERVANTPISGVSFLPLGWTFRGLGCWLGVRCSQYIMYRCENSVTPSKASVSSLLMMICAGSVLLLVSVLTVPIGLRVSCFVFGMASSAQG